MNFIVKTWCVLASNYKLQVQKLQILRNNFSIAFLEPVICCPRDLLSCINLVKSFRFVNLLVKESHMGRHGQAI